MTQTQLFKFTCSSTKSGIYLSAYASTIVYSLLPSDQGAHTRGNLIAIHFGGEPSTVQALCTLIASGMPLQLTTPEGNVEFTPRKAQYQKTITGSNGYAEAILSLGQEEKKEREEKKNVQGESYFVTRIKERRFYFYTPAGDDTRLFQLLDQHSHMPLLLGFQEYILTEARRCGALTPLTVLSSTETFDAWQLKLNENEQNLRAILETGLHERKITIPGADPHASDAFEKVGTISQYLAKFGVTVAERMEYRKVYFRIRSRYQFNSGWICERDAARFREESRQLFQNAGWQLHPGRSSISDTVTKGLQELYLHPMNFSGVIQLDEISGIQEFLKKADSFRCYGVDYYERYWNLTDEEYRTQLEGRREEIIRAILERCRTKRKNLYITGPLDLSIAQKFSVHRLCDKEGRKNLANRFVEELVEQLIRESRLVTAKTQNGTGIRAATDAELRVFCSLHLKHDKV